MRPLVTYSLPDPWEILNGSSNIVLPWGISKLTYQHFFTAFRYVVTGICIIAIMIALINIISSNIMGNSKDIQEQKRVISDKLLIIIIISMMATGLTWGKSAVDSIFKPAGYDIDLSSEQSAAMSFENEGDADATTGNEQANNNNNNGNSNPNNGTGSDVNDYIDQSLLR